MNNIIDEIKKIIDDKFYIMDSSDDLKNNAIIFRGELLKIAKYIQDLEDEIKKYQDQENVYKKCWEEFNQMLEEIKRKSIERNDRAFIYYDEIIDGNRKLEQKYNIKEDL